MLAGGKGSKSGSRERKRPDREPARSRGLREPEKRLPFSIGPILISQPPYLVTTNKSLLFLRLMTVSRKAYLSQ
jgi:hypothetical protein